MSNQEIVVLDGNNLTIDQLLTMSKSRVKLTLSEAAWARIHSARQVVQSILDKGEVAYGINTGFGLFAVSFVWECVHVHAGHCYST